MGSWVPSGTSPVPPVKCLLGQVWSQTLSYVIGSLALLSLYYYTTSQFHSLQFLTRGPVCIWGRRACARFLCVVDRVHTLNIASIGLHLLHILCLKWETDKQALWTKADKGLWNKKKKMFFLKKENNKEENNVPLETWTESPAVGFAWQKLHKPTQWLSKKGNRLTSNVFLFSLLEINRPTSALGASFVPKMQLPPKLRGSRQHKISTAKGNKLQWESDSC